MRDLLVITPTRGRLASAQRLISALDVTAKAETDLVLAVDDDDASYAGLEFAPDRVRIARGPRATCGEWTNRIAARFGSDYRALASLGDDHVPRTPGWDTLLLGAIDDMGGTGFAYGDDTAQHESLPTAPVMSSNIVAALGWMFHPTMGHFFCDNCWLDLGREAGCIRYVPEVVIEHLHYAFRTAPVDATYGEAAPAWAHDEAAYHAWRRDGLDADAEKIRGLRG